MLALNGHTGGGVYIVIVVQRKTIFDHEFSISEVDVTVGCFLILKSTFVLVRCKWTYYIT